MLLEAIVEVGGAMPSTLSLDAKHSTRAIKWLLKSDPAIRWQVMRDLTDAPADVVAAERRRVAFEGWGAAFLALQSPDGHWGETDRGWMTTTHSLILLKDLGVDPAAEPVRAALDRVGERIVWWQLDGRPYFEGETEPCINGAILGAGAYFGSPSDALVDRLLSEQLADGGWNCDAPPSTRSSFHSTTRVLEGLLEYEKRRGAQTAITDARRRAHEYLLERRMFRSLRSGEIIDRRWLRFAFPPTWHYDVLRGLDYLRDARVQPDERAAEAIEVVEQRRHQNGLWPLNRRHDEGVPFPMDPGVGKASAWNTLRALRVLRWYRKNGPTTETRYS